jgi:hypothetical protein
MQERRTTIRYAYRCHSQYCPSDDLTPRDGVLTNLSESGAGLLAQEPPRAGSLITVGFSLPGEPEPLTATGVVRWAEPKPSGRWYPVGLDWIPLEPPTRDRLQRFLGRPERRRTAESAPGPEQTGAGKPRVAGKPLSLMAGLVAAAALILLIIALMARTAKLNSSLGARDAVIAELGQESDRLRLELGTTRQSLEDTSREVAELDQQARQFGEEVTRLSDEVERFEQSYTTMQDEREALILRVMDLEQERMVLHKRLASPEQLRTAIREAIAARKQEVRAKRLLFLDAQRQAELARLAHGNRGFLVRNGALTTTAPSVLTIRVLEPETAN